MTTPKQFTGQRDQQFLRAIPVRLPDLKDVSAPLTTPSAIDTRVSDELLRKKVIEQLGDLGEHMQLTVHVSVSKGEILLKGTVDSHYNRLVVSSSISRLCGSRGLRDQLQIRSRYNEETPRKRIDYRALLRSRTFLSGIAASVFLIVAGVISILISSGYFAERLYQLPVKVTYNGKSAIGAQLILHPQNAKNKNAGPTYGEVQSDGSVVWSSKKTGDGIPKGEYVMTAVWCPLIKTSDSIYRGENILPAKLSDAANSPYKFQVTKGVPALKEIELKQ